MRRKRKALIILTPGFPKDEQDSACLPERQAFVKVLQEINPHIQVIVLSFQYPFFSRRYLWHHCDVRSFNGRNKGKIIRRLVWLRVWIYLLRLRRQYELVGLLSFWFGECALVGSRFAKLYGLKHYCFLLGQDAKVNNRFVSLIQPNSEMLIALSDFLAEEFFKNYKVQPAHIIPAGIDPRWFNEPPRERDIDILGVGSLIPLKQFDIWLKVVKELTRFYPKLKAVLIGKGPEMSVLAALAMELELGETVYFAGELPHDQVISHMQRSRLLLHPSTYEGFGLVIAEALYAGCKVISFCKPMKSPFENHYVVENSEHMVQKAKEVLSGPGYTRVATYEVQDSVVQVMNLFTDPVRI